MKDSKNHAFPSKTILNGMSDIAYIFNEDGKLVMWNSKLESVLGYSHDELYLSYYTDFIDEPFKEKVLEIANRIYSEEIEGTVEYLLKPKSGAKLPYIGSGKIMTFNGQKYMIGQAISIEQLKNTENELKLRIHEISQLKLALEEENQLLKQNVAETVEFPELIGEVKSLKKIKSQLKKAINSSNSVLLKGESGTGKETIARIIHDYSESKSSPFVKVNCANLVKVSNIDNIFFSAKNGTVYLDNINELKPNIQVELIHYLKTKYTNAVRGNKSALTMRVISSTQVNLETLVTKELFRKDLYFYVNGLTIRLPELRNRVSDIPILTAHFVKMCNEKLGKKVSTITRKTMDILQDYEWPGNIIELHNTIHNGVANSTASKLIIPPLKAPHFASSHNFQSLSDFERNYITKVLKFTKWRIDGPKGAALILDMHPETLRSRIKKLNIKKQI